MTQKDLLLEAWNREYQTTLKILKAYPQNKVDFKPHERSRSAKELAWTFVMEEKVLDGALNGNINFQSFPVAPVSFQEVLSAFEKSHSELVGRIHSLSETDLSRTAKFPVGPKQMGDVKIQDLLQMIVMDQVHHRGQFSVYLRMAGGKVPSIYGPTADEPWM